MHGFAVKPIPSAQLAGDFPLTGGAHASFAVPIGEHLQTATMVAICIFHGREVAKRAGPRRIVKDPKHDGWQPNCRR
jgi:hypothetical protein